MAIAQVAIPCMFHIYGITHGNSMRAAHMAHNKLHKTCMFHATRKCGPRKPYVVGLLCCHMCTNKVAIEWYPTYVATLRHYIVCIS